MNLTKYPLKYGVILGLIIILINQYAFIKVFTPDDISIGSLMLYSIIMFFIIPVFSIILAARSVIKSRTHFGGKIRFITALNTSFFTFIITVVISLLHLFIYGNFIDPDLADSMNETIINFMKEQPGDKEEIKSQIDKIREDGYSFKLKAIIDYLFSFLFISLILSLIISAVIKKDVNKIPE